MDVSEDIQRELIYRLNAELLRHVGPVADAAAITDALLRGMNEEGPRFHEPDLVADWARAVGTDVDELRFELEDTMQTILEELEDEEPWSAHRILDLLAEERFWCISWGASGGALTVSPRPSIGAALPLPIRPALVAILDQLELTLFEASQDHRSVHDELDPRVVSRALDQAITAIRQVGRSRGTDRVQAELPEALVLASAGPDLRRALATIQRWKLAVTFDAAPDDDDGEWTLRVLERLYGIEWVSPEPA